MLHHVSVGVRNVEQAARFYDAVLGTLGYRRVMEFLPYAVAYGENAPELWVQLPANQQPASAGNGVHVAFTARTEAAVAAFHRAALEAGGTNEGAAGPRPDYGPHYFGAFVRDPDGNKLEACVVPMPPAARSRRNKKAVAAKPRARRAKARSAPAKRRKRTRRR